MHSASLKPYEILAFGRVFACCSALGIKDRDAVNTLFKVLNQRMYQPDPLDYAQDCRPYAFTMRNQEPVVYVPAWARAGVNYLRRTDLRELDPADWYHSWWELYRDTIEDSATEESFGQMYGSLAQDEDQIITLIRADKLLVNRDQIRRLT